LFFHISSFARRWPENTGKLPEITLLLFHGKAEVNGGATHNLHLTFFNLRPYRLPHKPKGNQTNQRRELE
jgi:hypothetical protein